MRPPRVAVPSPTAVSPNGGSTKVLDIPSGKTVMEVTHGTLAQVEISPDGARLAIGTRTGSGGVIRIWMIPSGRPAATWTLTDAWPLGSSIVFSRDSRRIAVAADARSPSDPQTVRGRILIFEETSPTPVDSFFVPFLPLRPAFLPDGSGVLVHQRPEDSHLGLSTARRGGSVIRPRRLLSRHRRHARRLTDPHRRHRRNAASLGRCPPAAVVDHSPELIVTAVAVSPDGSRIAVGLGERPDPDSRCWRCPGHREAAPVTYAGPRARAHATRLEP